MNGYEQILVAVLATFLGVFIVLGIVLLVLVIKIVKTVRRITDQAEQLAVKAGAVTEFFQHAAGPMSVGRALSTLADTFFKRKDNAKRREK